jgi:hypothetical protein
MRPRAPTAGLWAAIVLVLAGGLAAPAAAPAARLVGGRRQAALARAFRAGAGHRHRVIVSIRVSAVSPAWAVVKSVTPARATGSPAAPPTLSSTYYHRVGGSERARNPPARVRSDLAGAFAVEVVYAGAGGESIAYRESQRSTCAGEGVFTDQEAVTVSPMAWSVRYVVDLDALQAAVPGSPGAMPALVPRVIFDSAGSTLDAVENVSRNVLDAGCNGSPSTFSCRTTFHLGGPDPAGQLSFPATAGLEVGLPTSVTASGACDPADYTLGPSLWDGGAGTALVGRLGLVGAGLPADPYAPIRVSWPGSSAQQRDGFAVSPCQGAAAAVCRDTFHWQGTVRLEPLGPTTAVDRQRHTPSLPSST